MTVLRGKEAVHPLVGTLPAILAKCSCVSNPLIYFVTNTQFRTEFTTLICGRQSTGGANGSRRASIIGNDNSKHSIKTKHKPCTIPTNNGGDRIAMTTIHWNPSKQVAEAMIMDNYQDNSEQDGGEYSNEERCSSGIAFQVFDQIDDVACTNVSCSL